MGILSSLFGLNSKEEEKTVVVKVPTKSVVEPTIKESLANLAIEVIGASERTALIPLKENNVSTKYSELVKLGLENSANAKILKKQLDNINYYNNTILKAQELLKYLKDVNNCLGNSVILVNTSTFYELCRKYNLSIGLLQDFTGVIPAQNLNELISNKLHTDNNASRLHINYQTSIGFLTTAEEKVTPMSKNAWNTILIYCKYIHIAYLILVYVMPRILQRRNGQIMFL